MIHCLSISERRTHLRALTNSTISEPHSLTLFSKAVLGHLVWFWIVDIDLYTSFFNADSRRFASYSDVKRKSICTQPLLIVHAFKKSRWTQKMTNFRSFMWRKLNATSINKQKHGIVKTFGTNRNKRSGFGTNQQTTNKSSDLVISGDTTNEVGKNRMGGKATKRETGTAPMIPAHDGKQVMGDNHDTIGWSAQGRHMVGNLWNHMNRIPLLSTNSKEGNRQPQEWAVCQ